MMQQMIGHNGGPLLEDIARDKEIPEADKSIAMMFANFHVNDILKTLFQMRDLSHRGFFLSVLIVLYDRGGYLPADDAQAAMSLCIDVRTYKRLKTIMIEAEKLRMTERGLTQDRVLREITKYCSKQKQKHENRSQGQIKRRENEQAAALVADAIQARSAGIPGEFRENSGRSSPELTDDLFENVNKINESQDNFVSTSCPSESESIRKKKESNGTSQPLVALSLHDDPIEIDAPPSSVTTAQIQAAARSWNDMADRTSLPKIERLAGTRARSLRARLREHGADGWTRALTAIEHSAFLTGQNQRSWRADFDWLVAPSNFQKVIEGRYGNGRGTTGSPGTDLQPGWWKAHALDALRGLPAKVWKPVIERMGQKWDQRWVGPHWSEVGRLMASDVVTELGLAEMYPVEGGR